MTHHRALLPATFALLLGACSQPGQLSANESGRVSAQAACTAWVEGPTYTAGQVVTYGGATYTAIQTHTAYAGAGWNPRSTPSLWRPGGTCDGTPPPPPPSGDTTPPSNATLSASPTSLTAAGSVTLSATASDNVGVTRVEFLKNGALLSTDTTPGDGFRASDAFSSNTQNGTYSYAARAFDAAGNSRTSAAVSVSVNIPGAPPPPPPATGGYRRVGYFTQWSIYSRNYRLADVQRSGAAATLTHLNYAFGGISPDLTCTVTAQGKSDAFADYGKAFTAAESVDGVGDTWDQRLRGNFNQLRELKARNPGLRVLISLGGWTWSREFSDVALTDASRRKFVQSCVDLYINGNLPVSDGAGGPGAAAGVFDGIDIDWEYPASEGLPGNIVRPEDTRNFTLLLEEFRRQLGPGRLLTAALPAAPSKIAKLEVANIARSLDLMNVMTYDFRGAWAATGPTNFHSNLYPSPADPGSGEERTYSVDTAVTAYLRAGAPAGKLVVGLPFYGRGWTGVTNANGGLYQRATGAARGTVEAGYEDYKVLKNAPGTVFRDPTTRQMWKFDGSTFWSYDDPQVIADKTAYIKQRGLGGAMIWSLDGDDATATLSKAVAAGLR
ncbi:glycosyl hydrolase family 18 protein [Deinococcus sp. YIM 134068]|uniref:glycosyl hydrolase family 18 protein n=1 Tax=Deinococcus lichenicola TaxID=3118910 RepID=UPI002F921E94